LGWIEDLRGETVAIDTAPLIYYIEENPTYLPLVKPFFQSLDSGEFRAVTSTVTLLEVLTHPFRQKQSKLVQQYRDILLHSENLATAPLLPEIAERAARLRAEHNVSTPDAIQLATALESKATYFLTNDAGLPSVADLHILILDNLTAKDDSQED
jgi:predicted nucleic acid-binding protein